MTTNRIQKLLFSEYCDFEDMVLVESPFAETTRDGKGLRQVQLGLTPTKLILATDVIEPATSANVLYYANVDLDIENFELISVFPVECVNLSVFNRRKRCTLKAHFCNNKILYFELGGLENRKMFWNLWCERVRFLSPDDPGSSRSETSVASSTSNSTIYLAASRVAVPDLGNAQVWHQFGAGGDGQTDVGRDQWIEGTTYFDALMHPRPGSSLTEVQTLYKKPRRMHRSNNSWRTQTSSRTCCSVEESRIRPVNRFGAGIAENCTTELFLPEVDYVVERRWSQSLAETQSVDLVTVYPPNQKPYTIYDLMDDGVAVWEKVKKQRRSYCRCRHPRHYGFSSHKLFLHGLGPWHVSPGERHSVQAKKAVSAVTIRRQPADSEMRLPVSRRQLSACISCDALQITSQHSKSRSHKLRSPRQPVLYFWTPEYWYRPKSSLAAYRELHAHLQRLRKFQESTISREGSTSSGATTPKLKGHVRSEQTLYSYGRSKSLFKHIMGRDNVSKRRLKDKYYRKQDAVVAHLRKVLKMKVTLTTWDFDSSTLAYQMTLIDKELFLKIPDAELSVLLWQQSSKNAPNIGAFIAFSHRISCLITSEILREDTQKLRARLITRFINVADKCNRLKNFQSCHTVLTGLQSPAVYRLHHTWSYVRQHHATKYYVFDKLCRKYRDPRLPKFQLAFLKASLNPPYLPCIGDLLARLLGRVPDVSKYYTKSLSEQNQEDLKDPKSSAQQIYDNCRKYDDTSSTSSLPNMIRRFISAFRIWPSSVHSQLQSNCMKTSSTDCCYGSNKSRKINYINEATSSSLLQHLDTFFEPILPNEDLRIQRLNQVSILLSRCQIAAANYAFCQNDFAWEFLLKARYQEERENFYLSLQLEPKIHPSQQRTNDVDSKSH